MLLSKTSKMPCYSLNISVKHCITGGKLRLNKKSVCNKCYANKGNYLYPEVNACLENRYDELYNAMHDKQKRIEYVSSIVSAINNQNDTFKHCIIDKKYFRFNDSGDLQGIEHLKILIDICNAMPKIKFWLTSKEFKIIRDYIKQGNEIPKNLTIRLSSYLINKDLKLDKTLNKFTKAMVYTSNELIPSNTISCKINNGKCNDCRLCWNKNIKRIAFIKH